MKIKHIHCPVNGWDCPYYSNLPIPCQCKLENPYEECDDFANMFDECEEYFCEENHENLLTNH